MPQKITLEYDGETDTVIVESTEFHSDGAVSLKGCDPSMYPSPFDKEIRFFSKGLTALIQPDDTVRVVSATPTDEPVPEPNPTF
jgi:hypothetical protein